MTRSPLLLRLDAHGLDAWQMHDRSLARVARFGAGEHAALATWLSAWPRAARCRVLVDLADEAFEIEDLPRVRGADRRALIARRLGSWFARSEFALATALGDAAQKAGRRFERFLFSGLNRPALVEPWLQAVTGAGHRVDRVVSAAHLLAHVVAPCVTRHAALGQAGPSRSTFVLGASRSGLRISLLAGRSLLFSRLVEGAYPPAEAEGAALQGWQHELARTRDYLRAQRRIEADETPGVLLLATATAPTRQDDRDGNGGGEGVREGTDEAAPVAIDPARLGALALRDESGAAITGEGLSALLLPALCRAPAHLGWPAGRGTDAAARAARRPLLALGAILVCAAAIGGWYWQQSAAQAAHAAAAEAAAARLRALQARREDDIGTQAHAQAPDAQDAAVAAPSPEEEPTLPPPPPTDLAAEDSAPLPRRIDGILRRPDGRVFLWVDGQLTDPASAGLRLAPGPALSLSPRDAGRTRLRVGDHWPPMAAPDTAGTPR